MMNLSKPLQNCEQTTSDNLYHEWSRKDSFWSTEEQQLLIRLLQDGARLDRICMALRHSPKAIAYLVQLMLVRGEQLIMVESMYQELATYCPLPHNVTLIKQLPPKKKGNKMNHNHVAALLQENFTTVGVTFYNSSTVYTYKVKTPHTLVLGDHVVVLASGYLKVAAVVKIDEQPQIDTDLDCNYQWIVQKVDKTEWEYLNEKESRFIEALKEVEKQKKRAEVIEDFKKHLAVDSAAAALLDSAVKQLNQVDTEEGETK